MNLTYFFCENARPPYTSVFNCEREDKLNKRRLVIVERMKTSQGNTYLPQSRFFWFFFIARYDTVQPMPSKNPIGSNARNDKFPVTKCYYYMQT